MFMPANTQQHSSPRRFIMYSRKTYLLLWCFFLTFFIFCSTKALAVTVTVMPSTAQVAQTITATVRTNFLYGSPTCTMQINFGDGTGQNYFNVGNCLNTGGGSTCTNQRPHSYSAPGTYTITTSGTCVDLVAPTSASTTVTITAPPPITRPVPEIDLPDGVVGMDYEYKLGDRTNRYTKTGGRIDHGLRIVRNTIKGVPEREGKYRLQIRATDRLGTTTDTWYNLQVIKALLKVTVPRKRHRSTVTGPDPCD